MQEKTTAGRIFSSAQRDFTLGLSAGEIAVYAYLLFCEDRKRMFVILAFAKLGNTPA